MPELPEVETIVRQLAYVLPGKIIQSVEVLREKSLIGKEDILVDKRIEKVERKQKMIVMTLSGDLVLLVHLKMTGQLIYESNDPTSSFDKLRTSRGTAGQLIFQPNVEKNIQYPISNIRKRIVGGHPTKDWVGTLPSKHTRMVVHFSDESTLYFNDQRVFGWVKIVSSREWQVLRQKMAPDVVEEGFTQNYLSSVLKKSGRAVKLVILDQNKIGGMGNIYANDALYLAGIDPRKIGNRVQGTEIKRLHKAMKAVIEKGIETGGASYSHFVDTEGLGGHYQENFLVYGREGEPCKKCKVQISKFKLGGRGTYFCPKCQR